MRKLWVFGDSFSEPYTNVAGGDIQNYMKWKGYNTKIYSEFIADDLNLELKSYGFGRLSNRSIISNFISVLDEIKEEDILIFGWTSINRTRAIDFEGKIRDVNMSFSSFDDAYTKDIPDISVECLQSLQINRNSSTAFYSELVEYMKWIDKTFKNNLILYWRWDYPHEDDENYIQKLTYHGNYLQTIVSETNGLIKDHHYSENGHRELADILIKKIL